MKLRSRLILLLTGVASAFANAPLPNSSYLGTSKAITMSSYNGTGTNGGGGAFNGTISGFATTMWCVDDQLYFAFGQSGLANVIGLNQVVPNDTRVRYGNVHNGPYAPGTTNEWYNQSGLPDSAQERYRMAAWLVSQYDSNQGDPQKGLTSAAKNNAIQNTIWALTNNNSTTQQNAGEKNPDPTWLALAKANYLSVNVSKWAVLSWSLDANGNLGTAGYGASPGGARQTFLVQVVPEPGFYGMLSLGLGGLFLAFAKRRKNEQKAA